jgi:hypothetical protein
VITGLEKFKGWIKGAFCYNLLLLYIFFLGRLPGRMVG